MRGCKRTRAQIRHHLIGSPLSEVETQQMQRHLAICPRCQQISEQEQKLDAVLHTVFEPYHAKREEIIARLTRRWQTTTTEEKMISNPWWRMYRTAIATAIIVLCILLSVLYVLFSQQIMIKQIRGTGIFALSPGGTQWIQVQEGTRLQRGSQLATNLWSQVELQAGLGNHIWLNQETKIHISKNLLIALDIEQGELFITQWRLKSIHQVRTLAGIVTPIGTSYDIRVAKNGDAIVAVTAGKVQFANTIGIVTVAEGYRSQAGVKQQTPPSTPTRIDTAPVIDWINKFKNATQFSRKTREQLAQQASILGQKYLNEQRYYDSLSTYQYITDLVPDQAIGYSGMGISYAKLEQYQSAIKFCYQALSIDSMLYDVRYNLAVSLINLSKDAEAKPHAEFLVKQVPSDHAFSITLAEIYLHLGNLKEAEQWYRYGLTQSPCDICARLANDGLKEIAHRRVMQNTSPP